MAKHIVFFALWFVISAITTAFLLFTYHPQVLASRLPEPLPISPTVTLTPSPTVTPSHTPTPLPTNTPSPRPTATPSPSPTPTSIPLTSADIENLFTKYSNQYIVSTDLLRHIANCESHFNRDSRNGDYGGMFQFSSGSWETTRRAMNENPDQNLRFNAEESIKTAAFKISQGQKNAWPSCLN